MGEPLTEMPISWLTEDLYAILYSFSRNSAKSIGDKQRISQVLDKVDYAEERIESEGSGVAALTSNSQNPVFAAHQACAFALGRMSLVSRS
ncbi:unnamed protein product [Strongylus vulgaris]|uniref:Uncharacterized protein n=1 Tax=Strongylus vulgaris TaxID=40348 RepID=A0A3P7IYY5_STRVU|nr:unnamed protein product [Strongylus vulgaris]